MVRTTHITAIICALALFAGCSDPQADFRARICKEAGVDEESVKMCKSSPDEFDRVMEPITAKAKREEVASFNDALGKLPSRSILENRYQTVSLVELSKEIDKLHDLDLDESKRAIHPLYGKHFKTQATVNFQPIDFDNRLPEQTTLTLDDSTTTWLVGADTDSLSREEKAFIKGRCSYLFEACHAEVFGSIGAITRGPLTLIGMQIEYIKIHSREQKVSSN